MTSQEPRRMLTPRTDSILHAGTSNGFIPEAKLVYKAGSATDYHGQMNGHNFQKWLTEKLLLHIPPRSITVLENAPYHCIQVDKPPTPYSLKKEMISWPRNKGVDCNGLCEGMTYTMKYFP
jgi:hypothetical protein